ncbi:WYL domain-containing protein [Thermomonospora sp. CIF 1]|uniref:helix-turn-helix transcriptional regulator n=1 Tax=Thermomonospora sp. CIF 1 TaxID=1916083 RepID=UPI000AD5F99C|nr:WYL domain-containing protein [Thermomonospora sp. CIF 1]PKK13121.1 MAG: WYL domain-containing protein [Thermomonospora sp. CIF 1]
MEKQRTTARSGDLPPAEIAALALSLAHLGSGPQAAAARRALRHLTADLAPADPVIADTLTTLTSPLAETVADRARVIAEAITERRVIRLCYADANANVTIREVEPVTCLVHREHWHVVGWCRLRRGVRAFRFDRILAVEPTGAPAAIRPVSGYLPWRRTTATAA